MKYLLIAAIALLSACSGGDDTTNNTQSANCFLEVNINKASDVSNPLGCEIAIVGDTTTDTDTDTDTDNSVVNNPA